MDGNAVWWSLIIGACIAAFVVALVMKTMSNIFLLDDKSWSTGFIAGVVNSFVIMMIGTLSILFFTGTTNFIAFMNFFLFIAGFVALVGILRFMYEVELSQAVLFGVLCRVAIWGVAEAYAAFAEPWVLSMLGF